MTAAAPQMASIEALPEAARASYLIYTREVRHPVEVGADQEAHLVAWLGKRLGSDIAAPDLTGEGFRLVGGRLIPYRDKPGALLMYEDEKGERLTILFGRNEQNTTTGFRFERSGDVRTFYWIDGPVGYAISGEIDRDRLQRISDICYRQL
jgi:anti-sigma factor RsiW